MQLAIVNHQFVARIQSNPMILAGPAQDLLVVH